MSQYDLSTNLTNATTGPNGVIAINAFADASETLHAGASRPSYLSTNGVWADTATAGYVIYKRYDGTGDRELFRVSTTTPYEMVVPSGTVASQANMEAEAANKMVDAAIFKHGLGAAKAWCSYYPANNTVDASYNISMGAHKTDNTFEFYFRSAMSSSYYTVVVIPAWSGVSPTTSSATSWYGKKRETTLFQVQGRTYNQNIVTSTTNSPTRLFVAVYGTLA